MIKFTPEQQETVDYILAQVRAGEEGHNVIVSGQGGVGKTEMVCELVCMLLNEEYRVAVAAMTGKATSVLRGKIVRKLKEKHMLGTFPKDNLLIQTVQKLTKESKVLSIGDDGETLYTNTWKNPENFNYDVLIIDELSMVPQFVSMWWQRTNARVIGLGDFCQLPEVTTAETKRELAGFRHDLKLPEQKMVTGYGVKVLKELSQKQLTKVLRSDNEVALLCNDLRDFKMTKRELLGVIKRWASETPNIQYSTSMSDLEVGDDWQIICYTNKMCQEINNQLCKGGSYPILQDKVLLFDNLNPIGKYNGETMQFQDFLAAIKKYNNTHPTSRLYVCVKWQGKMPSGTSKNPLEKRFFQAYVDFKRESAKVKADRMNMLASIMSAAPFAAAQVKEWIAEIDEMRQKFPDDGECFVEIIRYFEDVDKDMSQWIMDHVPELPRLYMVTMDYGYAITTHKSQGSEYPKVCYILERFDKPLVYTGISRAKEQVKIINVTKEG